MSLYGGISFGGDTPAIVEPVIAEATINSAPVASSSSVITTEAEKAKPIVWSSALNFAPNRRKKVATSQPTNSIPLSLQSAFNSAEESNVNKGARIVAPFKSALSIPTITAAPSLYSSSSNSVASTSTAPLPTATVPVRSGRILQAPSMTLDEEDVNGFLQTAKGKRAAGKQQGKGNKKKKKGAVKEDLQLGFDDTVYEPSKPCDYSAYKAHLQAQRNQRRLDREEERRRERSPSGSSYYSSDEKSGDEQQSSKKARLFAPPTSYNSPPPTSDDLPMLLPPTFTSAPLSQPNLNAAPRAETGEEAYLRRVALSAGCPPKPVLPPPQQQPQYPTFSSASTSSGPSFTGYTPPITTNTAPIASTSSYNLQPPPPPNFIPPPTTFGPFIPSDSSFPPFRPPADVDGIAIDPSVFMRPVASTLPLSDAAIRARDIAQRLGKLASMQPPTSTPSPAFVAASTSSEPDNRPFAERLMSKFGWKEGQGLGAEESGMTSALSVSKATAAPHPNSKKAKKAAEAPSASVSAMSSGRIIDAARSGRNAQVIAEIGEPSRVVLLTNLCGREDVDDDLGGEVAEEASKFGVVDRCFVYLVPGETRDDEAVRIFLVMSGLAGGYNAVSRFGGRFFGGRVVKARYYDERMFNSGEHRM